MTREEALIILKDINIPVNGDNADERTCAFNMAIKALEQEPCEDYVSRQEVLDVVSNPLNVRLEEIIKKLPSVNPQEPKTGHWECNELFYNGESRGAIITCSKCRNEIKVSPKIFENLYSNERFCSHCGAKMESKVEK